MPSRPTALVVDDEALIAMMFAEMLDHMGVETCATASTAADAVRLAEALRPRLVLMDVRLSGPVDGVDAALEIGRRCRPAIIFVTASRDRQTVERIRKDHPAALLFKPIRYEDLAEAVRRAL